MYKSFVLRLWITKFNPFVHELLPLRFFVLLCIWPCPFIFISIVVIYCCTTTVCGEEVKQPDFGFRNLKSKAL